MATTTRYSLTKPTVGADAGAWGGYLNANLDTIDATLWNLDNAAVKTDQLTLDGATSGSIVVVAAAVASGTLTLPAATDTLVGRATIDTLTNKTLDTAGAGNVLRINGTQVSTVTGTGSVVLATGPVLTSPSLVTANIGTPALGTLTNCTGLPVSTGISGLGSGVATFLATPSSANLAAAVTDETGTGALVFGTSPTIATPTITTRAIVPVIVGGTGTTSTLTLYPTTGVGTTGADIIFQNGNNGGTEVMRILHGGNVGIGVSTANTRLHVDSDVSNTDGTGYDQGQLFVSDSSLSSSGLILGYRYQGGVAEYARIQGRNSVGATNIAMQAGGGNVGIGTSSPAVKLDVAGSIKGVSAGGPTAVVPLLYQSYSGITSATSANVETLIVYGYKDAGTSNSQAVFQVARKPFTVTPAAAWDASAETLLTVAQSGNVGIGTSSPAGKLDIVTGVYRGYFDDAAGSLFRLSAVNAANSAYGPLSANGSVVTFQISASEKMRLDSSGNLLVGTTSSLAKLTAAGGTAAGAVAIITSGQTGTTVRSNSVFRIQSEATGRDVHMQFSDNVTNATEIGMISGSTYFCTGAAERMRIDSAGKVGINKIPLIATLDVNGQSSTTALWVTGAGNAGLVIDYVGASANYYDASHHTFRGVSGGATMVGIGAFPSYQLQLSTDSAAKPTTNTWTIASDSRLKTVKGEYQKGLAEICQVRPVSYEYNGKAGFIADGKDKVSILAQELIQVFPECVDTFKGKLEEDGPEIDLYNYNGHAITFALINAIKELKAEIDILKARN